MSGFSKACPFRALWPTLHYQKCDIIGCPGHLEFWIDHDGELGGALARANLPARILAGAGWICVVTQIPGGGAKSTWLCGDCAREMVDPYEPEVRDAQETQAHLARIEIITSRSGTWSPSAR